LAAWLPLTWRAKLVPGETVLVLGATGTVGSIAVQLAQLLGAGRIIAPGRDPDRLRRASELGANKCVLLPSPPPAGRALASLGWSRRWRRYQARAKCSTLPTTRKQVRLEY
jgi:NADPH:quinone reductase-like Zn-dependent oxidoreductase